MRVLIVSNLYPPITVGGYEACCELVTDALHNRHQILVLTSNERTDEAPFEPWVERRLPLFSGVSGDALTAALVTRRAINEVRRVLDAFSPDLCLVWGGARIPKGALRTLETSGVPLVFSICDYWFDRPYDHDPFTRYLRGQEHGVRRIWSALTRVCNRIPSLGIDLSGATPAALCWCSEATRRLTSVSETIAPVLQQTIYLATPHESVFSAVHRQPNQRARVAFVGRLSPEKGPDIALRALRILAVEHGIEADLVMCGTPAAGMREKLDGLMRELGVEQRVRILGGLGPDTVAEELSAAHVLIVPSVWQEPFGLVCLEGALARVPIVASRSGGMTEMLVEDEHALFFPIGDAAAAAAAMADVFTRPQEAAARVSRACDRAREFAAACFTREYERFVERAFTALVSGNTATGASM